MSQGESANDRFVRFTRRISINLFAGKVHYVQGMFRTYLTKYCCDDEGFVGKWPGISGGYHTVDNVLTVAHFAFASQYANADATEVLESYLELSNIIHIKII